MATKTYVIRRTGRRNPAPRIKLDSGEELKLHASGPVVRPLTDDDVKRVLAVPGTELLLSTARVVRPPPEPPKVETKRKTTKRKTKAKPKK